MNPSFREQARSHRSCAISGPMFDFGAREGNHPVLWRAGLAENSVDARGVVSRSSRGTATERARRRGRTTSRTRDRLSEQAKRRGWAVRRRRSKRPEGWLSLRDSELAPAALGSNRIVYFLEVRILPGAPKKKPRAWRKRLLDDLSRTAEKPEPLGFVRRARKDGSHYVLASSARRASVRTDC